MDRMFPRVVFIVLLIFTLVAWYPLSVWGSTDLIQAVVVAGLIATVNVLLGYAAIEYSFRKSTATFFKVVLGGMGIRLLMLGIILFVLIKAFGFRAEMLVGSLGVFYLVYLVVELVFIQKRISQKQDQ